MTVVTLLTSLAHLPNHESPNRDLPPACRQLSSWLGRARPHRHRRVLVPAFAVVGSGHPPGQMTPDGRSMPQPCTRSGAAMTLGQRQCDKIRIAGRPIRRRRRKRRAAGRTRRRQAHAGRRGRYRCGRASLQGWRGGVVAGSVRGEPSTPVLPVTPIPALTLTPHPGPPPHPPSQPSASPPTPALPLKGGGSWCVRRRAPRPPPGRRQRTR